MAPLVKLVGLLGLCAAAVIGYKIVEARAYGAGYEAATSAANAEAERVGREHAQALADATADALARERAIRDEFAERAEQWRKEESDYEKRIARLTAAARAGDIRLRVPVDLSTACASAPGADTAAAAGTGREEGADVLPSVAADLIRIAADSARDVRDFNRLRELYEVARETCR